MVFGVGVFHRHGKMLRKMSHAYVENRDIWIKCSYIKARNDYIKTRDAVTDSIVFYFDMDEDVESGDILLFNEVRYVLANVVADTFFEIQMRKRSAGIELYEKIDTYRTTSSHSGGVGISVSAEYLHRDVWIFMYKDVTDRRQNYDIPYDSKVILTSSIYDLQIGDGFVFDYGNFYIKDIDMKMKGCTTYLIDRDTREFNIND